MRALLVDFNGTLSHDEELLFRVYSELFEAYGRPLAREEYFAQLAGRSEEEIVRRWLGPRDDMGAIVRRRVERYVELAAGGRTVPDEARAAVRLAAASVPVVVVSGAFRAEIEPVLAAAGLDRAVAAVVAADDVGVQKPDPECYWRALSIVGLEDDPAAAVALEDTDTGIAAAKGAGVRCLAVSGTLPAGRLAAADAIVARLTPTLVRSLLAA